MSGLLIDGKRYEVPGVITVAPLDRPWVQLSAGDGCLRQGRPNKVVLHKTKADDPEIIVGGAGPFGRAERVAEAWASDPVHSGAHMVAGSDYVACLADLVRWEAYHARAANKLSIGIEMYEEQGGLIYSRIIDNTVACCRTIASVCGIQAQFTWNASPLVRFRDGGRTLIGFFGHRNVDDSRNRWDPGNAIWNALALAGFEAFDVAGGEDIEVWKKRQRELIAKGHDLGPTGADGFPGRLTTAALLAEGYHGGIYAFGRDAVTS
jgi:hypothetical protein